ncbi:MAG: amidohydrolase, partial [Lacrimispora sp.]
MQKADIILRSNAIFNGIDPKPFSGFVAVRENKILAVSDRDEEEYAGSHTQIIDLENRLICPGFTDVHCF